MSIKRNTTPNEPVNIPEVLTEIEKELKRLGILYNQYFAGVLKQAPSHLHTTVERQLRELAQDPIRNPTLRHRYQMLQSMFASLQTLWTTRLREMETGKRGPRSKVEAFSAKKASSFLQDEKKRSRLKKLKEDAKKKLEAQGGASATEAASTPAPAVESAAASAPSAPVAPSTVDRLFDKIASFQMSQGQPLTFESPDHLASFLKKQKAKIEQQTGAKNVQLKLVVEEGKLRFKAQIAQPTN